MKKLREQIAHIAMMIILLAIVAMPACGSDEKQFEPWDFNNGAMAIKAQDVKPGKTVKSLSGDLLIKTVRFYQDYLSPVIGERCPMYPSCSAYSIEAITKHGFFIGFAMTVDRLIHESNEMDIAPIVKIKDQYRYYDPLEYNDFWWFNTKIDCPSP